MKNKIRCYYRDEDLNTYKIHPILEINVYLRDVFLKFMGSCLSEGRGTALISSIKENFF